MTPAERARTVVHMTMVPVDGAGSCWVGGDRDNIELAIIGQIEEAVLAQREADAKVADDFAYKHTGAKEIAAAIRAH